ncbi:hypothetical protein MBAV_003474 [Candidatus Magnetobacterium bavaricum]|uniref:Uncharacterized protein n=1 Tax=Candidatus Magnetobacterium bavaricum TaxID=29290 RepID=A0A0F3GQV6_9BACT|nr:hypothetical protein MBAV_003474 [Candidatus Magnetobacterium bavaricum]
MPLCIDNIPCQCSLTPIPNGVASPMPITATSVSFNPVSHSPVISSAITSPGRAS